MTFSDRLGHTQDDDSNANASQVSEPALTDRFLVCGLGSLGQYCVYNLKRFALREFEVHITAIDRAEPSDWEVENLFNLLSEPLVIGDCRLDEVLLKAGIQHCRAILIVTSHESANIETAIAAHRLNPTARLIVRSSRQSLNRLLKQELNNFVAFDPTDLPAPAFALAGFRTNILGFFNIGDYRLQVVQHPVLPKDYRFDGFPALLLHKNSYRLLSYSATAEQSETPAVPGKAFYQWQPDTQIKAGDTIAYIEVLESHLQRERSRPNSPISAISQRLNDLLQISLRERLIQVWQWIQAQQTRQIVALGFVIALLLWMVGTVSIKFSLPDLTWQKAISIGVILLLGGYGDIFGGLENDPVPWWVQLVGLLITIVSLLFVLGALGIIADLLLASRFDFLKKRPAIPKRDHVVLVGLGRLGQRIATVMQEFKQPIVAITEQLDHPYLTNQLPLLVGNPLTELAKANLATAKSVVVVTDDEMLNLEVALMARDAASRGDRTVELVIRTYDQRFSTNLTNLLPEAKVLAAYALSGEAFAGAAFGENILGLFRLNEQTILITEYCVSKTDTLVDKLLAEVAYGYGVVPILHQRGNQPLKGDLTPYLMPSDDRYLQAGDRLIILSSINGLRRIERGTINPPRRWRLTVQKPLNPTFIHYGGNDLARITGCHLDEARAFMNNLPGSIDLSLYNYQAYRLEQELGRRLSIALTAIP